MKRNILTRDIFNIQSYCYSSLNQYYYHVQKVRNTDYRKKYGILELVTIILKKGRAITSLNLIIKAIYDQTLRIALLTVLQRYQYICSTIWQISMWQRKCQILQIVKGSLKTGKFEKLQNRSSSVLIKKYSS